MEWILLLVVPLILGIVISGVISPIDLADFMGIVFSSFLICLVASMIIGSAITPEYIPSSKIEKLQTMSIEGKEYYYIIDLESKEIIVQKGVKQEVFSLNSINSEAQKGSNYNEFTEPYIETTTYSWDDTKFPHNLFITSKKNTRIDIYIPSEYGYILPQ